MADDIAGSPLHNHGGVLLVLLGSVTGAAADQLQHCRLSDKQRHFLGSRRAAAARSGRTYGPMSGLLPADSTVNTHREPYELSNLPSRPKEVAAEAGPREAEIAVVEDHAPEDPRRRLQAMAQVHSRSDRRRGWMEFDRPTSGSTDPTGSRLLEGVCPGTAPAGSRSASCLCRRSSEGVPYATAEMLRPQPVERLAHRPVVKANH